MNKVIKNLILGGALVVSLFAPAFGQSPKTTVSPEQSAKTELVNAAKDYKQSLGVLAVSYDESATKADDKVKQLKGLLDDGLISKRDYDAAVATAADAHGKADVTHKQIAAADGMIADALKPIPTVAGNGLNGLNVSKTAWSTGNSRYDALIRENGARYGVDPYLIFCVMEQESHFSSTATSPVGAQGLMQLMPDTAARFGVMNSMDAAQSIAGGTKYLRFLLQMFKGRVDLALASYNAGEGAVLKYGGNIPPFRETVAYVRAIGTKYGIIAR
jgi:hypothetical protein